VHFRNQRTRFGDRGSFDVTEYWTDGKRDLEWHCDEQCHEFRVRGESACDDAVAYGQRAHGSTIE
jgi:hypothetical protein